MQGVSYSNFLLKKAQLLMATQELPGEFDVIVVGTGLEESIVAAAAARNGHTVLHIDENKYYGGDWAAFNLDGILEWADKIQRPCEVQKPEKDFSRHLKEEEDILLLNNENNVRDVKVDWFAEDDTEEIQNTIRESAAFDESSKKDEKDGSKQDVLNVVRKDAEKEKLKSRWTKSKIQENSRKFNLDLTARLLFSRGSMVELLISSNISRYAEFKSASRVLTVLKDGKLEHVPSSRADVFATRHVSVVEKRILMKFITFCVDFRSHPEVWENFKRKTYLDFLKHQKLTENLINFVISSIAMVPFDASCEDGLNATQKFLCSIGRFGNTPFLWSMYGSGELPQAFCRLCAVFGGTYFLGKPVDAIVTKQEKATAIIFNGQRISCKHLVLDIKKCPTFFKVECKEQTINRKICLLSDSIMPAEKEQLTFVSVPPDEKQGTFAFVEEVGFGTAACPKGMYVLHMTNAGNTDLSIQKVLNDKRRLLFSLSFKNDVEIPERIVKSNVYYCTGPIFELDYDTAISNAEAIYRAMYEGEEFLPRAPDPEEIVTGSDETGAFADAAETASEKNKQALKPDKENLEE